MLPCLVLQPLYIAGLERCHALRLGQCLPVTTLTDQEVDWEGLAYMENLRFYLWSVVECPDGENVEWAESKVIELRALLADMMMPSQTHLTMYLALRTDGALFTIDLHGVLPCHKTLRRRSLLLRQFPLRESFCTPGRIRYSFIPSVLFSTYCSAYY
jgi:hypothetical protein